MRKLQLAQLSKHSLTCIDRLIVLGRYKNERKEILASLKQKKPRALDKDLEKDEAMVENFEKLEKAEENKNNSFIKLGLAILRLLLPVFLYMLARFALKTILKLFGQSIMDNLSVIVDTLTSVIFILNVIKLIKNIFVLVLTVIKFVRTLIRYFTLKKDLALTSKIEENYVMNLTIYSMVISLNYNLKFIELFEHELKVLNNSIDLNENTKSVKQLVADVGSSFDDTDAIDQNETLSQSILGNLQNTQFSISSCPTMPSMESYESATPAQRANFWNKRKADKIQNCKFIDIKVTKTEIAAPLPQIFSKSI